VRLLVALAALLWCLPAASAGTDLLPWFNIGGEIRGRAESTFGLGYIPGNHDSDYLNRVRLRVRVAAAPWFRFFAEVQDARVFGLRARPVPATMTDTVDLRQGYAEVGSETSGWTMRVGRQPLIFGASRLVSTSNWGNVGPAYDGARLTWRRGGLTADWFATAVVRPACHDFDRPRWDRRLDGAYVSLADWRPGQTAEAYFLFKSDPGASGRSAVYTQGGRAVGKLPLGFDYGTEMAVQHGHVSGEPLRAWAGNWGVGYARPGWPGRLRLAVEYNYASGDRDPHDGRQQTFDNHYPTNKYATADNIGWRNIHETASGPEFQPGKRWKVKVAHRAFWLASRQDALYSMAGAPCASSLGAASAWVGQEADVRANWQPMKPLQIMAGGGRMFPGAWLRQATRGAHLTYLYGMWTVTF
jgi:hypothetical protein